MKLSRPSQNVFIISLIVFILGLLGLFAVAALAPYATYLLIGAWIILALGCLLTGM